ncbi:conserved hypothetical protein [Methanococcus vannielii SB]|uniref:Transporter n=1 Tax=Methanococcus vannielii (strain ATCC 35089 / DSM 1224 / JCM 13029 / OCM 148 / SB) TaxID=406327 RepID=A6UNM0_METVS|nr:DUF2162 domain-containing protein [Methanococcus vannielii]ABR54092.1 conserved hypothetical protein [Methanococcus vannielii SB]
MIEDLWQLGLMSAIIIFGIKIGLSLGFSGISKKISGAIILLYGLGTLVLSKIASGYAEIIQTAIYDYNFVIFVLMSAMILYAGFHTINSWKQHGKNSLKISSVAMIAPCPCCFGAVIASIVLISPMLNVSTFELGKYASLILMITIFTVYMLSNSIAKILKMPRPLLMGNFMIFAGLYFLISALIIPNIVSSMQLTMNPIEIPESKELFFVSLISISLFLLGYIKNKKVSKIK